MRELADAFNTPIIGGDTNSWPGKLTLSITLLGEASPLGPVLRSGARPGDWLLVTGPLGGSILGKHLDFTPRVAEARRLQQVSSIHAMIDISDGLAGDLNHICGESRCGAILRSEAIPISSAAREMRDGRAPLEHALTDGEDFELLLAVAPSDAARLIRLPIADPGHGALSRWRMRAGTRDVPGGGGSMSTVTNRPRMNMR